MFCFVPPSQRTQKMGYGEFERRATFSLWQTCTEPTHRAPYSVAERVLNEEPCHNEAERIVLIPSQNIKFIKTPPPIRCFLESQT